MDRYPYYKYTILLGATRALAHIGIHFTHRVFGLSKNIENSPNPFVEPCIVTDLNLPGVSPPLRQVKLVSRMMGNYLLRFGEDSTVS